MEFKLKIELVPKTIWFQSLFQLYRMTNQIQKWQKIKKDLFKTEGRRCWICGNENTRLEAHEFWIYDDKKHIQTLSSIHHLCSMCHKIKHIGFWCYTERGKTILSNSNLTRDDLIKHFCAINNCSKEEFDKHERGAFKLFEERSKYQWTQDLGEFDPNIQ